MTLPKIPDGKNYSEATWRAGLDEAVRLSDCLPKDPWSSYHPSGYSVSVRSTIAHATTLLDAGIVKPVVSEAAIALLDEIDGVRALVNGRGLAFKAIQSALDKARAGE